MVEGDGRGRGTSCTGRFWSLSKPGMGRGKAVLMLCSTPDTVLAKNLEKDG